MKVYGLLYSLGVCLLIVGTTSPQSGPKRQRGTGPRDSRVMTSGEKEAYAQRRAAGSKQMAKQINFVIAEPFDNPKKWASDFIKVYELPNWERQYTAQQVNEFIASIVDAIKDMKSLKSINTDTIDTLTKIGSNLKLPERIKDRFNAFMIEPSKSYIKAEIAKEEARRQKAEARRQEAEAEARRQEAALKIEESQKKEEQLREQEAKLKAEKAKAKTEEDKKKLAQEQANAQQQLAEREAITLRLQQEEAKRLADAKKQEEAASLARKQEDKSKALELGIQEAERRRFLEQESLQNFDREIEGVYQTLLRDSIQNPANQAQKQVQTSGQAIQVQTSGQAIIEAGSKQVGQVLQQPRIEPVLDKKPEAQGQAVVMHTQETGSETNPVDDEYRKAGQQWVTADRSVQAAFKVHDNTIFPFDMNKQNALNIVSKSVINISGMYQKQENSDVIKAAEEQLWNMGRNYVNDVVDESISFDFAKANPEEKNEIFANIIKKFVYEPLEASSAAKRDAAKWINWGTTAKKITSEQRVVEGSVNQILRSIEAIADIYHELSNEPLNKNPEEEIEQIESLKNVIWLAGTPQIAKQNKNLWNHYNNTAAANLALDRIVDQVLSALKATPAAQPGAQAVKPQQEQVETPLAATQQAGQETTASPLVITTASDAVKPTATAASTPQSSTGDQGKTLVSTESVLDDLDIDIPMDQIAKKYKELAQKENVQQALKGQGLPGFNNSRAFNNKQYIIANLINEIDKAYQSPETTKGTKNWLGRPTEVTPKQAEERVSAYKEQLWKAGRDIKDDWKILGENATLESFNDDQTREAVLSEIINFYIFPIPKDPYSTLKNTVNEYLDAYSKVPQTKLGNPDKALHTKVSTLKAELDKQLTPDSSTSLGETKTKRIQIGNPLVQVWTELFSGEQMKGDPDDNEQRIIQRLQGLTQSLLRLKEEVSIESSGKKTTGITSSVMFANPLTFQPSPTTTKPTATPTATPTAQSASGFVAAQPKPVDDTYTQAAQAWKTRAEKVNSTIDVLGPIFPANQKTQEQLTKVKEAVNNISTLYANKANSDDIDSARNNLWNMGRGIVFNDNDPADLAQANYASTDAQNAVLDSIIKTFVYEPLAASQAVRNDSKKWLNWNESIKAIPTKAMTQQEEAIDRDIKLIALFYNKMKSNPTNDMSEEIKNVKNDLWIAANPSKKIDKDNLWNEFKPDKAETTVDAIVTKFITDLTKKSDDPYSKLNGAIDTYLKLPQDKLGLTDKRIREKVVILQNALTSKPSDDSITKLGEKTAKAQLINPALVTLWTKLFPGGQKMSGDPAQIEKEIIDKLYSLVKSLDQDGPQVEAID